MRRLSKLDVKKQSLIRSIEYGHISSAKLLMDAGIICTSPDLFIRSCANNYLEMVKLLIAHGSDPINSEAIKQAHQNGHSDIVELLVEYGNLKPDPIIIPKPVEKVIPEQGSTIIAPAVTPESLNEVDQLISDFREKNKLENHLLCIQNLRQECTDINVLVDKLSLINFEADNFSNIFIECNIYRASIDQIIDIHCHLNIFRTLINTYLHYNYDYTLDELVSMFMRTSVKNRILRKAVIQGNWYVAKYLLKIGSDFIVNDNQIKNFLSVRRDKFLLMYILDNCVFDIVDFSIGNGDYKYHSQFSYGRPESKTIYISQLNKYIAYLRKKFIFICALSYPVDLAMDSHANAITDVLSYIRKLYIQLFQPAYINYKLDSNSKLYIK